jgi:hypothetical protein
MKRKRSLREIKDYINTIAPAPDWLKAMQARAKRNGLDKLTMREINAIIAEARKERGLNDHIPQAIKDIRAEAKRKGLNKITMREINAEIAAYRKEKQAAIRKARRHQSP